jgi:stage II sporulation protein AB (anti-sigma F factor)
MKRKLKGEINRMELCLPAVSVNEGMARAAVAAFCVQLSPSIGELADIKCAVSEAVTNCIVHAYAGGTGELYITVILLADGTVRISVRDRGCGIADVKKAREPLYTTGAVDERSGMGFTVMENFMDRLTVRSRLGVGTLVTMSKRIGGSLEKE